MEKRVTHHYAVAMLMVACALWGTSFPSVKFCGRVLMQSAPGDVSAAFGPLLLTALRFTLALPLVLIVWPQNLKWRPKRSEMAPLLAAALPMALGFLAQATGLAYTTATISGFITGMCVCITPVLEGLLLGKHPTRLVVAGAGLATLGVALMTLTQGGPVRFGWGEGFTLLGTFAFALQIVCTGRSSEELGAARLTFGSFVVVAVCAWVSALAVAPGSVVPAVAGAIRSDRFGAYFLLLLLGATIGASIMMNTFQRFMRPSEAAIVYTTEPLFASVFAIMLIGSREILNGWGVLGAALMVSANLLVAERPFKEKRGRVGSIS